MSSPDSTRTVWQDRRNRGISKDGSTRIPLYQAPETSTSSSTRRTERPCQHIPRENGRPGAAGRQVGTLREKRVGLGQHMMGERLARVENEMDRRRSKGGRRAGL